MVFQFSRIWLFLVAILGSTGVALSAVVAHAIENPAAVIALERATNQQLMHTIALLALSIFPSRLMGVARFVMLLGILIFSGAIYARYLLGIPTLGQYAPYGGTLLIVSWLLVGISALTARTE